MALVYKGKIWKGDLEVGERLPRGICRRKILPMYHHLSMAVRMPMFKDSLGNQLAVFRN